MMKISAQVQSIYYELEPVAKELELSINKHLQEVCNNNQWLYIHRVKSLESFAQKLETGRYSGIEKIDDLFACTIVVQNIETIEQAAKIIKEKFNFLYSRPTNLTHTKIRPENFVYDSLRMYCRAKQIGPFKDYHNLIFEIQIKTFLEHAWAIATHDFSYKTDTISWGRERIVSQMKAMLDNIELTINNAEDLAETQYINKIHEHYKFINAIIAFYKKFWNDEKLPADKRRLALNTQALLAKLDIKLEELEELLKNENLEKRGSYTLSLSPFQIIVQTIINQKFSNFETFVNSKEQKGNPYYLLLTENMDIPNNINFSNILSSISDGTLILLFSMLSI